MAFSKFRDLGKVQGALSELGIEVAYAYDDLVFTEHNTFMLRFDDECENNLFLHFNKDCTEKEGISKILNYKFETIGCTLTEDKNYDLVSKTETETFDVVFL